MDYLAIDYQPNTGHTQVEVTSKQCGYKYG